MQKLISIGEVLIDFIPDQKGIPLKDVKTFKKAPGGAPANVAACVAKLGAPSVILSKLGNDAFGDSLIEVLTSAGVNTDYMLRTSEANTALAFVSLTHDGNRDFSFYRNPSADMLLKATEIQEQLFASNDILHFCSVSLIDAPVKEAHNQAIKYALENNVIISFDPNVRLPLWDDPEACKQTIKEYIKYAHIIKISDEELHFITGIEDEEKAIQWLFQGNVKIVLYSKGSNGAELHTKDGSIDFPAFKIDVKETTGAGDSFIGAFLYQIMKRQLTIDELDKDLSIYKEVLKFSNAVGAIVASRIGALESMPTLTEVYDFIHSYEEV